jgi:hypothetical protein
MKIYLNVEVLKKVCPYSLPHTLVTIWNLDRGLNFEFRLDAIIILENVSIQASPKHSPHGEDRYL